MSEPIQGKTPPDGEIMKALAGTTCYLGGELMVFDSLKNEASAQQGRPRMVVPGIAGQEAFVIWVAYKGQRYALKLMRQPRPERRQRIAFLSQLGLSRYGPALAAAPLHPVCGELSVALPSGQTCEVELLGYLSQYIEGHTLAKIFDVAELRQQWHALSRPARIRLAAELAHAILLLERAKLVHGDLHPGNIILEGLEQQPLRLRLIDFDNFYHHNPKWAPLVPVTEQQRGGRVEGGKGYIHRAIRQTKVPTSDRLALAALCFEIVALDQAHWGMLGNRRSLLSQKDIDNNLIRIPAAVRDRWPAGWALVDKTLGAEVPEQGSAPEEWLDALEALVRPPPPPPPSPPPPPPPCRFELHVSDKREPRPGMVLVNRVKKSPLPLDARGGDLGEVCPELAWLRYEFDESKQLVLRGHIERPPLFHRRSTNAQLMSKLKDIVVTISAGDEVSWDFFRIEIRAVKVTESVQGCFQEIAESRKGTT